MANTPTGRTFGIPLEQSDHDARADNIGSLGDLAGDWVPPNATSAWLRTLESVYRHGSLVDNNTVEIINGCTWFDLKKPVVLNKARKINYRFMAAEAHYIISGQTDVRLLSETGVNFNIYSDMFPLQQGSYGPMFVEQLRYCVESLVEDELSRQAVMTIWRPNPRPSKDIPCTLSLQFIIRENKLHCIVNMRSSDIFTGLIYDMFCFSMMANVVAAELNQGGNLELGSCYINAASSHLYTKNCDRVVEVLTANDSNQIRESDNLPCYYEDMLKWLDSCVKMSDQTVIKESLANAS